jgi:hypothetical protein
MRDRLLDEWSEAARDLDLDVQSPFAAALPSGTQIRGRLLLRNFGAENGMIVVTDYSSISPFVAEIVRAGYGFCTLSEPSEHECYDREVYVEMLRDWGWVGAEEARPLWCLPTSTNKDEA